LFNAEDQERYFRIGRSGFSTGLVLSMGDRATLELAWKIQLRRLLDVEPSLILDSDPWAALLSLGSSEDGVASFLGDNLRPQSGLRLSLLVDRRDDPFNPRKGVAFSSEIEISDGLGGFLVPAAPEEASWVRLESAMVLHIPVRRLAFQLRLRGGSGFVGGEGTLPLEDRFRLGGSSTMRGFDIDSLGPAEEASGTEVALPSLLEPIVDYAGRDETRWVATGGDTMGLLSVEMKIPLDTMGLSGWSDWQFAVFADMGNVWFLKEGITTESMETQDDPLLRYSVGVGLRRATVVGPIQLDLGFNPSPLSYRGEVPAISWVPIPFQLYLSLGAI
jgi:outer membrane protein assembly factor BamA